MRNARERISCILGLWNELLGHFELFKNNSDIFFAKQFCKKASPTRVTPIDSKYVPCISHIEQIMCIFASQKEAKYPFHQIFKSQNDSAVSIRKF